MLNTFVETKAYRRFIEFCNVCRDNRYIGICHGPPGVGKTLSARRYSHWDEISALPRFARADTVVSGEVLAADCLFYTASVTNTPGRVEKDIAGLRESLRMLSRTSKDIAEEMDALMQDAQMRERKEREAIFAGKDFRIESFWEFRHSEPTVYDAARTRFDRYRQVKDPVRLILIDEADFLKFGALEQLRCIFDRGGIGLVFIGMPGLYKKLEAYPQLSSRVGFTYEFKALSNEETRELLLSGLPAKASIPDDALDDECIAAIIRITNGNFRLIDRLLREVGRIIKINQTVAYKMRDVIDKARENLIIGSN